MTNDQFRATSIAITRISEVLCQMPLEEFLADCERGQKLASEDKARAFEFIRAQEGMKYLIKQSAILLEAKEWRAEYRKKQPSEVQISNAIAASQILELISRT